MNRLDLLGLRHNTDKASLDRVRERTNEMNAGRNPGHDFLRKYAFYLDRYVDKKNFVLIELGAGPDWNIGASAQMWKEYFWREDFRLHIVDIKESTRRLADKRTQVTVADLGDLDALSRLSEIRCDVVIDDASHFWGHQIATFATLFPKLAPGGLYIIEDIHTSFGPKRQRWARGAKIDAYSVISGLLALVAGKGRVHPLNLSRSAEAREVLGLWRVIDGITIINEACLIMKKDFY